MEQMMERLLVKLDADRAEIKLIKMLAKMKTVQAEMLARMEAKTEENL
jgi:hypothetical protein